MVAPNNAVGLAPTAQFDKEDGKLLAAASVTRGPKGVLADNLGAADVVKVGRLPVLDRRHPLVRALHSRLGTLQELVRILLQHKHGFLKIKKTLRGTTQCHLLQKDFWVHRRIRLGGEGLDVFVDNGL